MTKICYYMNTVQYIQSGLVLKTLFLLFLHNQSKLFPKCNEIIDVGCLDNKQWKTLLFQNIFLIKFTSSRSSVVREDFAWLFILDFHTITSFIRTKNYDVIIRGGVGVVLLFSIFVSTLYSCLPSLLNYLSLVKTTEGF